MRWILFLFCILSFNTEAFDYPYTMRSPKALLMGDAFTAVNDDEYTLFYNPASMARPRADFTLTPLNPSVSGTNVLADASRFKNFPSQPVPASKVLMDYPVHASIGIAPGFRLFNVGVSFISNNSYDALLRNQAHPMLDLDIRADRGVMMGIGIPLGSDRLNKKTKTGSQTSIGVTGKYIERTGIQDSLALAGPTVLNSLNKKDVGNILNSLGQVKGIGYGFDVGLEQVVRSSNSQFVLGLSALDVTNTNFRVAQNPDHLKVANLRRQVNLGMAVGQDYKIFHYILSADVRGLNEQMDTGKRLRFGAELGFPGLKLLAGVNSGYYSYGAMLDLFIVKVTAGFYDVELGSQYKQTQGKRFILYLSLFDFTFDA
jgi:hypothetical protein